MNSGGYGSSAAPRLPLFLCSEMNFRQIMFSETQGTKEPGLLDTRPSLPFMLVLAIRGEIVASFAVSYFSTRGEWH